MRLKPKEIKKPVEKSPALNTSQIEKVVKIQGPPFSFLCFSICIPGFSIANSGQLAADSTP